MYLCQRIKTKEKVLLKSFKNIDKENITKLHNEYNILQNIEHENIIKVHEIEKILGKTYLIREYLEGQSLEEYLNNKTFDLNTFLKIAIEISKAISFLHKKNIIHKNLSLSSILIDGNKNIKIIDFDCASSKIYNINENEIIDSLDNQIYKAPEQSQGIKNQIDNSVDIYSLGVIFYRLLSGSFPFSQDKSISFSYCLLAKEIPLISTINKNVPEVISKIVQKMMAKNKKERYHQVLSIQADLNKCLISLNKNDKIKNFQIDEIQKVFDFNTNENIYGRNEEKEDFINVINSIKHDNNALYCISGDSGLGKSSLINYVLNQKKEMFSYIVKVKIDKYKQNTSYELLYFALRNLTKTIIAEDKKSLNIWKNKLKKLFISQAQLLIDVIPEIEIIIGKQDKIEDLNDLDVKVSFDSLLLKYIKLFCDFDKPLCIFIDDVQWADFVLLKWLENSILNLSNVLFVVSYRDKEIDKGHLFSKFLSKMSSFDRNILDLKLLAMSKNTIQELIKDSMNLDEVNTIAEIIYQKTRGNSFFVKQYLIQLQKDEIIYFDAEELKWNCDLDKIYKLPISDNVFDILSKRIILLPSYVQDLLNIVSCIGSNFSKDLVKKVYDNDKVFDDAINILVKEEWIIEDENKNIQEIKNYHFSHDRMQDIVYSSLSEKELLNIHLLIANNIVKNNDKLENKNLITCVNHFNIASSIINKVDEKEFLAKLNIKACKHALKSGDFINALRYSKDLMLFYPLLEESEDYISILVQRAQCEQLCINNEEAIKYYDLALSLSLSKLEQANIYELMIKFYTDISDFKKAYEIGRRAAELFNLSLPISFNKILFISDFIKIKIKLKSKNITDLFNLPKAEDENIIMLICILSALLKVTYQIRPELSIAISIKLVNICLKHGNTKESILGYMVFGVIFEGAVLGKHNLGYEYSNLSMLMLEKYNNTMQYAEVEFVCGYFSNSWKQSCAKTELDWHKTYKKALEVGDWFHSGCSAAAIIQSMFMRGVNFKVILNKIEHFEIMLKSIGAKEQHGAILSVKQSIKNLQGNTPSILSFSDENFDEISYVKSLEQYKSPHFAHYYFINKMISLYIHKKYKEAFEIAQKSKNYLSASKGMIHNTEHDFYYALISAKLFPIFNYIEKIKCKFIIKKTKNKFKSWANNCSENFLLRAFILEGEEHRINKKISSALESYDKAIETAKIYGQVHLEAITNDIIASMYKKITQKKAAIIYTKDANKNFHKWGIKTSKNKEYEYSSQNNLDINTIMKAVEAMLKEHSLSNLLKILIEIIIENAGAEHGVLLLFKNDNLLVQAEASINSNTIEVMQEIPYLEYENIVHSLIDYSLRLKEEIVIDNIQNSTIFSSCKDVKKRGVKAVLCVPLILHGRVKGVIYLENNIFPDVFTSEKLELIKHLSGQIIISIENAQIYNQLEEKIEERTKDLHIKNKELLKLNTNIIKENEERKKVEKKLQIAIKDLDLLATTDGLTKLKNRRSFDEYLSSECKRSQRSQEELSLLICDVDFFKKYNDLYGHQKGDFCLQKVAEVLSTCIKRPSDFVARYGGEEFAIILPNTNRSAALILCQNIHDKLKEYKLIHEASLVNDLITFSIGLAVSDELQACNPENLIKKADQALYKAKEEGRNRTR